MKKKSHRKHKRGRPGVNSARRMIADAIGLLNHAKKKIVVRAKEA